MNITYSHLLTIGGLLTGLIASIYSYSNLQSQVYYLDIRLNQMEQTITKYQLKFDALYELSLNNKYKLEYFITENSLKPKSTENDIKGTFL